MILKYIAKVKKNLNEEKTKKKLKISIQTMSASKRDREELLTKPK